MYRPQYRLLTAQSGKEGIKIAKAEKPDTILLDIIMPVMDGYEVCKQLKQDKELKYIPIIFLTAFKTSTLDRIMGLKLGADVYLTKTVEPGELVAQIEVMLRIKKAEDKLRSDKVNLNKLVEIRTKDLSETNTKLRFEIAERKQAEEKLIGRSKELETWSEVTTDRELLMLNLKKEINELLEKSGEKPKYKIPI
jgi:DNA-binding response OmpR family regulator